MFHETEQAFSKTEREIIKKGYLMKCSADCQWYKRNDSVAEMEDGVAWYCTMPHSQCEDVVCLLRMILWSLDTEDE